MIDVHGVILLAERPKADHIVAGEQFTDRVLQALLVQLQAAQNAFAANDELRDADFI